MNNTSHMEKPEFQSLPFEEAKDYETLCTWWKLQDWPPVPKEFLPPIGILVSKNGRELCAGFIYRTDSSIALMEWIVADPRVETNLRSEALDILIQDLSFLAKQAGYKRLFSTVTNRRLIDRAQTHGFKITDTNATHLLKEL